ncbi:MAG: hypothetical protein IID33_02685, partial [Planctomycetes bacterium]|nr:hypothetical protein [Planctomycetota bacterium]
HAKKKQIWGVILHTPNSASHQPLRIQVGFIAKDYDGFAAELIDLKVIVEAMESTDAKAAPRLRLRTDPREAKGQKNGDHPTRVTGVSMLPTG